MNLRARPCTRQEMAEPWARAAAAILGEPWKLERKLWEYVVLYEGFRDLELFRPECLGFGCGKEPLPLAYARLGARVLATDQSAEDAVPWLATDQWGGASYHAGHNLTYRDLDMRAIPRDLHGRFDFVWSSCALEHLGGLEPGLRFILAAMDCLRPGGWAFHTTELNVTDRQVTLNAPDLCLYRPMDVDYVIGLLRERGHTVPDPDWALLDAVDPPGPANRPHLTLDLGEFATTSLFLAVQKGAG